MKKIKILNNYVGEILFEHECVGNTIKITLEQAVKENVNLENANLGNVNLENANLGNANLKNAYLKNAYLYNAYLENAYLYNAYLYNANLYNANLENANLENANLENANLGNANLGNAYLYNAYLENAYLYNAYLYNANLYNANLENANLENANLYNANLENAHLYKSDLINLKHLFQIIPEEGQFIAWKKASGQVLKLKIPANSKRTCNIINRKCRAEFVKTLAIENVDGSKSGLKKVKGNYDDKTIYEVGKTTRADRFNDDLKMDCTNGIHFFIARKEAEEW